MLGIRQKLFIGFGGLLVIAFFIGVHSIKEFNALGTAIDVILRENYRSVLACQNMKESLERIDSGILYSLLGYQEEGTALIEKNLARFGDALNIELQNITLPDEKEKAESIQADFERYRELLSTVTDGRLAFDARRKAYFEKLQPLFMSIKNTADAILVMNQENMDVASREARTQAKNAGNKMVLFLLYCTIFSIIFSILVRRWILKPVNRLIDSTKEIQSGNLELVIEGTSRDEIGRLSEAFNAMTVRLREMRRSDRMEIVRTRKATEEVFKALPTAIAVLNPERRVEVSTGTAKSCFGLEPGVSIDDLPYKWLVDLVDRSAGEDGITNAGSQAGYVQQFIDNREYFFQPLAMPTKDADLERTGTVVILKDVTQIREQEELKRSVISTVSHQLKTPLTSLRMSIHLLLGEKVGYLNEKQSELLQTAEEDCERLAGILDDLLDISRIESGSGLLRQERHSPESIVSSVMDRYLIEAKDKGIELKSDVGEGLPGVMIDIEKIKYVFDNLLSNAFKYTSPGGSIVVGAEKAEAFVRFSVADSGTGIRREHQAQVFEQFYRVPEQGDTTGAGLGLAIVKEIIEAHGGTVGVESEEGEGSNFYFALPSSAEEGRPVEHSNGNKEGR